MYIYTCSHVCFFFYRVACCIVLKDFGKLLLSSPRPAQEILREPPNALRQMEGLLQGCQAGTPKPVNTALFEEWLSCLELINTASGVTSATSVGKHPDARDPGRAMEQEYFDFRALVQGVLQVNEPHPPLPKRSNLSPKRTHLSSAHEKTNPNSAQVASPQPVFRKANFPPSAIG